MKRLMIHYNLKVSKYYLLVLLDLLFLRLESKLAMKLVLLSITSLKRRLKRMVMPTQVFLLKRITKKNQKNQNNSKINVINKT